MKKTLQAHEPSFERKIPKVLIDARMIGVQGHGIARYVTQIARGLALLKAKRGELPYEPRFLVDSKSVLPAQLEQTLKPWVIVPVDIPFLSGIETLRMARRVSQEQVALYHTPSFASFWGKSSCPVISTVHDLIHLRYGGWKERIYYRHVLRPFLARAALVTTVSETSKRALMHWTDLDSSAIEVWPNAISEGFLAVENGGLSQGLSPRDYFLCVSNSKPHKNVRLLVEAYQRYRSQQPHPLPLVLTCEGFSGRGILQIKPSELDLRRLIQNARGLFFPSLMEGFGLPPIESLVSGTPVILSSIDAHQEAIAGLGKSAEKYVKWAGPHDLEAWSNAFTQSHQNPSQRPNTQERAGWIQHYSAARLGERVDQGYQKVLGLRS